MGILDTALPSLQPTDSYTASTSAHAYDSSLSVGKVAGAIGDGVANVATSGLTGSLGLSIQRIVVIILGLILVGAGIIMLKPVQETIVKEGKSAAKAATVA